MWKLTVMTLPALQAEPSAGGCKRLQDLLLGIFTSGIFTSALVLERGGDTFAPPSWLWP